MIDTTSGDCMVEHIDNSTGEVTEWVFRPSFKNLSRIGSPHEIVGIFGDLYGSSYEGMLSGCPSAFTPKLMELAYRSVLQTALHILHSCYEGDGALVKLLGGFTPNYHGTKILYQSGKMPPDNIIALARSLLRHGMIGTKKSNGNGEHVPQWNPAEFIDLARTALKLPLIEAEQLTMTRFQRLIDQAYPDTKKPDRDIMNKETYMALMRDIEKKKGAK
jgi:hypothetical protein